MTSVDTANALAYYARIGAALFPCRANTKTPILKWKDGSTSDTATIAAWRAEGHNLAVDCNKSGLLVIDVDASKVTRELAWNAYLNLCKSWGIAPVPPMTQSARDGWHIPFKRPADLTATDLRGGGTLVKISDVRPLEPDEKDGEVIGFKNRGYCVAAGSTFDGRPYLMMPDAPEPPVAPAALIEAIKLPPIDPTRHQGSGDWNHAEVFSIVKHLHDTRHEYVTRGNQNRWKSTLAVRNTGIALTDELYEYLGYEPDEDSKFFTRWERPDRGDGRNFNMQSLKQAAIKTGWSERAQKTAAQMFGSVVPVKTSMVVADIIANAGGTPSSTSPGMPMTGGQAELTRLATPILEEFLSSTGNLAPSRPMTTDIPELPAAMCDHGLYALINESIVRVLALVEMPKFKPGSVTNALAVIAVAHKDIFDSVKRRVENVGRTLNDTKIKLKAKTLEDDVQRAFIPQDDWVYDQKGLPESDNPDNVVVFLGIISAEIRWNAWLNRAEIQGFEWPKWVPLDDVVIAKLKMRALRTGTRFRVGNEFLKETLLALAQARGNVYDPVLEYVNSLTWDGKPRLLTWLSATCGVSCDAYHQAVSRNVIGGMIKRIRKPGDKHDEVMILIGAQGTEKSTLCRVLALNDDWFSDSVSFEGSPQNIVPQLFGKLVVELAELDGMARKEVQHIKAFITRQSDNVTLKYKAFASDHARRCVFIGTSNEDSPLSDISGNRRFLPVRVAATINVQWLRDNIEQLMAEAAHRHAAGEDFSIPKDVWAIAAEHQEAARSINDIEARLREWFALTPHTASSFVTTMDLAELSDIAGWRNVHALRNSVMKHLGFREVTPYIGGVKTRAWLRGPDMLPRQIEQITRYIVSKTADNRPRVTIRMVGVSTAAMVAPPPY